MNRVISNNRNLSRKECGLAAVTLIFVFLAFSLPLALGANVARADSPVVDLHFDHFYDFEELEGALRRLAEAYPKLLTLSSLGKSFEGRDMWLMTINNPATGFEMEKAAMWIDGNVHGNEVQASETCLYTVWSLMENYGRVEEMTRLVDERVFYVLPSQNPDGRAWWFDSPNTSGSSRSGKKPVDNDGDGVADEDGYDDLDGDGHLLLMRRKNANGRWKVSSDDPRLMTRAASDERGEYDLLGTEGIDNDGDGRINEDGPGGYDLNRNWPSDWQPEYVQFGASEYPLCHPESRAISEFFLAHPNIAGVQSYHNAGGMILRGPGSESFGEYPREDVAVYDVMGEKGEKMLPFYRYMVIWKDLYTVYGGFVNWTYEGLGIFSFTNELWSRRQYSQKEQDSGRGFFGGSTDRLEFDDLLEFGDRYVEWKPFDHPTYGPIEIGGWKKETGRVPPLWMLRELCHRNFAFTMLHADQMPMVEMKDVVVEKVGDRAFSVTAEVENTRLIPTISARARQKRIGLPDFFSIQGEGVEILAGGVVEDKDFDRIRLAEHEPARLKIEGGIGSAYSSRATVTVRWFVTGSGEFKVTYSSQKGGVVSGLGVL